jgi:hypothetical protein|tara:strand:- start:684 stop:914 length:231 start_codon:yes stop_codon:yes gene_type:complete
MKTAYLLITMLVNDPIVYNDKATCLEAMNALQQMQEQAVCIPKGNYQTPKDTLDSFFELVIKMQNLPPKEVDIREE